MESKFLLLKYSIIAIGYNIYGAKNYEEIIEKTREKTDRE